MLLSAECTVEVVKHMLTIEERGVLRQTCKAFRELRVREDYFDVQYVRLLRRNGIQLTTKDGEPIIQCTGWLLNDTSFSTVDCMLDQFARIIKGIHKDKIPRNSIVSVTGIVNILNRGVESLDKRKTSACIKGYGGYSEYTFRHTIELDRYTTTQEIDFKQISFPKRIPDEDEDKFYAEKIDYITYPELILSPSDT